MRGFIEQGLRQTEDIAGRLAHAQQFRRRFEDLVHGPGDELEQFGDLREAGASIGVLDLGHVNRRVAAKHAFEHLAETAGVAAKGIGGLYRGVITGQHGVDRTQNALGQQQLTLGHRHLARRRSALQEDLHYFFVFDLQLRHGLGQRCRHLVQRQHGLLAGQDGVGILAQVVPVLTDRVHLVPHGQRRRRQPGGLVALAQITPAPLEVIARIGQQLERQGLAGRRFGGVLGDALGQHAQLAGVADVLFVVVGLGIEVREVGEQQDDRQDEHQNSAVICAILRLRWLSATGATGVAGLFTVEASSTTPRRESLAPGPGRTG